jgi:RNA polymerase sigma-70 factor (sigma-E family)
MDRGDGLTQAESPAETGGGDLVTGLYLAHYSALVRLAALLLDDPASCEDIVQEAYVRVWARQAKVRDQAKLLAYLRQSVLNLSRSALRRRRVAAAHRPVGPEASSAADLEAISAFAGQAVVAAMRRLPRRQREVTVLRYFGGLSELETAEALGISVGSVKAYASRALADLATRLEEWR